MQSESKTKMTRTTRMIYVEEISDTQNTTSAFPSPGTSSTTSTKTSTDPQACSSVQEEQEEQETAVSIPAKQADQEQYVETEEERQIKNEIFGHLPNPEERPSIELSPIELPGMRRKSISLTGASLLQRKAVQHMVEMRSIEDALLYTHIKPLFTCLKLFGLFFPKHHHRHERSFQGCIKFVCSWQFYSILTSTVLLLNFLRSLFTFNFLEGFGYYLIFKIVTCILFYESASRAILAYICSARRKVSLQNLFLHIETICYSDKIIPYENGIKYTMRGFMIITFLVATANCGTTAYGMFGPAKEAFIIYIYPFSLETSGVEVFQAFVLFLVFVNGMVAILSLSQFTILCYVFYKEFEYHHRTFVMKIREDGEFSEELEKFRIMHQKRCKLVQEADQIFKYYVANTYLTNIPLLCLLLYSVINTEENKKYFFIHIFRLCYVLLQMTVVSVAATAINIQAHGPLADIYNIKVQDSTRDQHLEMAMFLNKLTGTQIGLTPWDMFVINKPTVLTVIGMIITYFFLLIQFSGPTGPMTCQCVVTVTNDSLISVIPG